MKEKDLLKIQSDNKKHKEWLMEQCRIDGHEIDYYFKGGKEVVICFECDSLKNKGTYLFGGMKRYLENNQN